MVSSQKSKQHARVKYNYIQTGLFFSFSETEMVQLFMKVDVTATKLFSH